MMAPIELVAGEPYRLNDLARLLNRNRLTVEKYIERFSLKTTKIHHLGREIKAVILTQAKIDLLLEVCAGEEPRVETPPESFMDDLPIPEIEPGQPIAGTSEINNHSSELLEFKLEAAQARLADCQNLVSEKDKLFQQLIQSKESEISTLKTALVIAERHSNQIAVNIAPRPMGLLGKLKEKLGLS